MSKETTPRYAPNKTFIVGKGRCVIADVIEYKAYPVGYHPANCPIGKDYVALELVTAYGSAWWGFDDAYINSELRMVVVGFSDRCEIRRKWEVVPEHLR